MTQQGQPVLFRAGTSEFHAGVIAGNITNGGNTADVLAWSNGGNWASGQDRNSFTVPQWGVDRGSGVGQWQDWPDPESGSGLIMPTSVSVPTRTLGTPFQPSSTRPVLVSYSARISSGLSISGGAAGRIELFSDAASTPTTSRGRVAGGLTGTVVVGVTITDISEAPLIYLVPAGHFVLLSSITESGTPTFSLTTQWEIVL